jgi:CO/xanthine dehydrogenase FAD-binding subunit
MDLNTIEVVVQPPDRASLPLAEAGDAFLAGGTWLFSEPQTELRRLVDLTSLGWNPLKKTEDGLDIAATCTLAELEDLALPMAWPAASLITQCCRALLGSFKIRSVATVGGNLCLALPAGPMAALLSALDGACSIWTSDGGERQLPVMELIVGPNRNALGAGEILRKIHVPAHALTRTAVFRKMSRTPLGRSAALLIGTRSHDNITLTITGSVARPAQLSFNETPDAASLTSRIDEAVPIWYDDAHGAPMWRKRITHIMAADIIAELALP